MALFSNLMLFKVCRIASKVYFDDIKVILDIEMQYFKLRGFCLLFLENVQLTWRLANQEQANKT